MKNLSFALLICVFTFGCASKKTTSNDPKRFNNIAVISVMDAPTNPLTDADKVITQETLGALKSSNKNSFELQVDSKIVMAEREQALALKDVYLGNRYQTLEKYFLEQAGAQNADYLLVIHPSPHPMFASYTPGYGLYCARSEAKAELQGYFLLSSELWDVKKQEVVRRVQLSPTDLSFNTGKKCTSVAISKNVMDSYKENFTGLAKKSSGLILSRTGIL